jgi:hypothetical protein
VIWVARDTTTQLGVTQEILLDQGRLGIEVNLTRVGISRIPH